MYYYAMCGQCPSRANWYRESTEQDTVDEWAHNHLTTYGHAVSKGQSETSFNPRGR